MTDNQLIALRIELGRTCLGADGVRQLRSGAVVSLDGAAGEPVDLYAAGRLVARGQTVVHENRVAVRVVELVSC